MLLITGGTGFVGSHLLLHFAAKKELVLAFYRKTDAQRHVENLFRYKNASHLYSRIQWIKADITDAEDLIGLLEGVTEIVHCAAKISFQHKDRNLLYNVNVKGTANLINACLEQKVPPRICFISSTSSLDIPHLPKPVSDSPVQAKEHYSFYGLTKFLGELEMARGEAEGLQTCWVNPGVILGAAPSYSEIQKLFSHAKNGMPFYSEAVHGFTHIDHVVHAVEKQLTQFEPGQNPIITWNLPFRKVQTTIAGLFHKKGPRFKITPAAAWILYFSSKGLSLLGLNLGLSRESVRNALESSPIQNSVAFPVDEKWSDLERVLKDHLHFQKQGSELH